MITIKRFTICISILLAVCIGCMYWIYDSRQVKINHLQHEVNILFAYKLNEPALREQIAKLKADKALLQQDVAYYKGKWTSGKMFITYAIGEYTTALIWINVAELVFENNDITFPLYLGSRELREVK